MEKVKLSQGKIRFLNLWPCLCKRVKNENCWAEKKNENVDNLLDWACSFYLFAFKLKIAREKKIVR